jgi:hypothetical protein
VIGFETELEQNTNGAIEDGHGVPCPYGRAVLASGIVF